MPDNQSDIKKAALDIIDMQQVITIATSDNGVPWAAPVYYIFYDGLFYFFSKPDSRHIADSLNTGKSAASIHSESSGWADIRGVQMEGVISAVGINKSSGIAFSRYIKKFNFIKEIKQSGASIKDLSSLESTFKVKFYKLKPDTAYYIDNSIRFGFRERVRLYPQVGT